MAFLNEIDKKLTMIGQGAIQKTKEVSDTAKITAQIKSLENQKNECYTAIGKLFCLNHIDIANEQERVIFERINTIDAEIKKNQEQMSRLKGVIYCEKCNAEIPTNSVFCNVCGAKVEQKSRIQEPMGNSSFQSGVCKRCGVPVEQGQLFCINCGSPIEVEPVNVQTEEVSQAPVKETIIPEMADDVKTNPGNICTNCGKTLGEDQLFCIYCGTPVKQ